MLGKIKVIGANNQFHEWMEKEFENCKIDGSGSAIHYVDVPERGSFPFDIYKTFVVEDRIIFEGYASFEETLGRLAIEFFPQ